MIVYSGVKRDFLNAVEQDRIAYEIEQKVSAVLHRRTPQNEFRSWKNSLEYVYKVLNDADIPENSGVAIEYNIPQTSKRVDFMISGYGADSTPNVVIIELKQWDEVNVVESQDALVETYVGGGLRRMVHPSYQAWSYSRMISDYNENVQDRSILLHPCAYLHNYRKTSDPDKLEQRQYLEYVEDAPVFASGEVFKLRSFIKGFVRKGDDKTLLYEIENGKIKPSKSLQDSIRKMIEGNPQFIMIDEQKVVYEQILSSALQCRSDGRKRTLIVKGGPGTGKTVIAVNLLARLTNEGLFVQYTSKNSAPRSVYAKMLSGHSKSSISNMFKGSSSYYEVPGNAVGVVLCDEAHRLNEKSGVYHNKGENQIKEIINAALCSVFFIDERQRIALSDIGSVSSIRRFALELGSSVQEMELVSQFRCNGSDGYLAWLDNVLGIGETANFDLDGIDYDFRVVDTPFELRDLIMSRNEGRNRSRILAGYCWDWPKEGRSDTSVHDIRIGDFGMSWNLESSSTYAIDEDSVNEVGCIHTSQGLEFDYVGVIVGDDMRFEEGRIVTDFTKRASSDQSLRGIKTLSKENPDLAYKEADEIIKNTYRTLMTRGMKGCYVFCTDKALSDHFRDCMRSARW